MTTRKTDTKTLYVRNRSDWRRWLETNHRISDGVWLLYYKKGSGKPRIAYDAAVEEALCFGWIDSKVKRIDEACYAQKFTPRKPESRWSVLNLERARKLMAAGSMTEAGLKAFNTETRRETPTMPTRLPEDLQKQFARHTGAWQNFKSFPPYYQRMTARWVASAKKEETRLKRLRQLIEFSARNERIKFM